MASRTWTWPGTIARWRDADTDAGQAARDWANQHVPPGTAVTVTSHSLDRYGRILGTITTADGTDYGTALTAAGHAQPYQ